MSPISNPEQDHKPQQPSVSRGQLVFFVFLGMALFLLLAEHQAHLYGILPYLLILACPLMHFFMHRNHSGHGKKEDR